MYRDLRERGVKTWTEEKLASGKKKAWHVPSAVRAIELEARAEQEDHDFGSLEDGWADNEDEDVMLRGDVESDEEFIMGGDGYDDWGLGAGKWKHGGGRERASNWALGSSGSGRCVSLRVYIRYTVKKFGAGRRAVGKFTYEAPPMAASTVACIACLPKIWLRM
jgi:hypothetical protein